MKIVFRFALLIAAAALGVWLWAVFFPSPQKVIQRKIVRLAATATLSARDGNLARAAKAANLAGFFAADAQIIFNVTELPDRTLSGREEIRETALAGFANVRSLNVQFLDVSVRLSADGQTADVSCTAEVNAGDNKDFGVQELHFQLKKIDGDWLITLAETVRTLS
jgi:hypothetical protein